MDTLLLHYTLDGRGGRTVVGLHPMLHRNDGRLVFLPAHPDLGDLEPLLAEGEAILAVARRSIQAMGPKVSLRAASGFSADLRGAGSRLARRLLPENVVAWLLGTERVRHVTFCVDPRLNGVPFDWMWLDGDFVAHRFATGRELLSASGETASRQVPSASLPFTARLLLAPPAELSDAERGDVVGQVTSFYSDWSLSGKATGIRFDPLQLSGCLTRSEMLDAFRTREVLLVYSHHRYDAQNPLGSGYALGSDEVLSADELWKGCPPGQRTARLVLSLCCESGITQGWDKEWPRSDRLHGIVDAAQRMGIPHYVGTWVKIPALKTPGVMAPFFGALSEGQTVGESLRRARQALRGDPANPDDGGTVLGLALTLYGNPSVAYLSRSGRRTAEVHAPICEAVVGDRCCGAAISPSDAGYASRRCPEHEAVRRCSAGHGVTVGTKLAKCSRCDNEVCPRCSGWGRQLCWEHCSFEGQEILAGFRKVCLDPAGRHPDEKRSITLGDSVWRRTDPPLCRDCLVADGAKHPR